MGEKTTFSSKLLRYRRDMCIMSLLIDVSVCKKFLMAARAEGRTAVLDTQGVGQV